MSDVDGANARLVIEDAPSQVLGDITHVRITAIIKSDERVTYDAEKQDSAASSQIITHTAKKKSFRWVKRYESSAYASGTELVRDDGGADGPMADEVNGRREEREALGLDVSLSIPWVEFAYRVGDRIVEVDGRDVSLARKPGDTPSFPMIREITYDFEEQETRMEF